MKPYTWAEISDSFPGIHNPEVAIKKTAEACKKLGLLKCNHREYSPGYLDQINREANRARNSEKKKMERLAKKRKDIVL